MYHKLKYHKCAPNMRARISQSNTATGANLNQSGVHCWNWGESELVRGSMLKLGRIRISQGYSAETGAKKFSFFALITIKLRAKILNYSNMSIENAQNLTHARQKLFPISITNYLQRNPLRWQKLDYSFDTIKSNSFNKPSILPKLFGALHSNMWPYTKPLLGN